MENSEDNNLVKLLTGRWKPYLFHFVSLLAIILVVVGAWFIQQFFEERIRAEKGELITVVLKQTRNLFHEWNEERREEVTSWARTHLIRETTLALLKSPDTKQALQASVAQEVLREILLPILEGRELQGFFVISKKRINLASGRDVNIGEPSVLSRSYLDRAFAGESLITLPQRSEVMLPDAKGGHSLGQPTMFSLAPVMAKNGDVIALLAFRLDVMIDFSQIFDLGKVGETGETYAFNKAGQLLSESRYIEDLRNVGLLGLDMHSIFNLQLRDPGGNVMTGYLPDTLRLLQPLTLMAEKAIQGEDGINLQGYNNYRGVPVIGVWHWDDSLSLGIATEIDIEEAYATLRLSRKLMIFGVSFSVLAILVLNIVFNIARSQVARSETSMVNAQRIAHLGSWDWDIAHNRLEWSDETYRIFKQDPKPFKSSYEAFLNAVHPDDRETVTAAVDDTLKSNKPYQIEHRIICPDGSERIVLEQGVVERDVLGDPAFLRGSVLDITDRKKVEQELTLFKTTLDMIEDSVFMFNPHSLKFFYVNQAAIQQLGYTEEELLNMTPADIKPEFDDESFMALLNPLIKGPERTLLLQTMHERKNGSRVPVDIVLQYLVPKDESPRFVAIVRDFSEHQQIERQLKTEKEKAEQATQYKSEFLANMSHEIRTPMNGVLGMLELLGITQLDEKQKNYLSTAENSAKSLLTIINDILDFSKIEAGHMQLENVIFNLHNTVEDSVISTSKQAETKQLDLNSYISADVPPFVIGDPVRLRQIITNLASNAIKFTTTGEINVRLRKISDNDKTVCLCFEVEDTGVGIEKDKLGHLFNAFIQADGSTTRKYGGTGLGLSICKQLVSMMGGEISVSSKPGSGSIFSFITIFSKVAQRVISNRQALPQDLRVLVVDDNDTNRTILGSYLSRWNVQNVGVGDTDAVLPMLSDALAVSKPYHVILLDFHMPKIDGLELAKKIKADKALQNIHLILLSSSGELDYDADEGQPCIERHLTKPVRQSDLYDVLLQVTGLSEQQPTEKDTGDKTNVLFSSARVLLVDDVATNQAVGSEMLNKLGIKPVLASDGQAALREIKKTDFDLVLMDCQMPVMDGYTATEIIRAQEQADGEERLPVIALTANAMKGDREACIAAGMDDYLAKPISLDGLRSILSRWLPDDKQHEVVRDLNEGSPVDEDVSDSKTGTAKPADVSDSVLDSQALGALMKLAGDRFASLIDSFERDINKNLLRLRDALKQSDVESVVLAAHAMKGAGMNMAAIQFSDYCKKLEMRARESDISNARGQIKNIENEYQRAIKELRKFS